AQGSVAGGADPLVAEAAGLHELAAQRDGDALDEGAGGVDAEGEGGVAERALPRNGPGRRRLQHLAVGKSRSAVEGAVGGLVLHAVEAPVELDQDLLVAARRADEHDQGQDAAPHGGTSGRPKAVMARAPRARRMLSARVRSNPGASASTARKKRSLVAR